ncbi:MAG: diguanylate cyclase [Sulfuricurvum sp.]|nr:diguanylate cyclase [Sulfuricurvum sp.]
MPIYENIYQSVFKNAPIGIGRIGLDGQIIEVNSVFATILNYTAKDLSSKKLSDIIDPIDYSEYLVAQQSILSEIFLNNTLFQYKFQKNGTTVMISCALSLVRDTEQKPLYFIHVIKEINDQEYKNDQLQASYKDKRFIDYMLDHTDNLMFVTNKDSNFVYVNDTVLRLYGYTREELLSMSIQDIDDSFDSSKKEEFMKILSQEKILHIQSTHTDKNGILHPVYIRAQYIEYKGESYNFGLVEDQSRLQALLDLQEGFVILTDGKQIQLANHHLLEFFNYPAFTAFKEDHKCICEFFINETGFISNHSTWVEDVKKSRHHDAKVKIQHPVSGVYHIFLVRAAQYDETRSVVTFIDITELEEYKEKLKLLATTDELTGLYNRRIFNKILPQEINRAKRDGKLIAMMMLDVDFFKQYNDTYGHVQGDDALIKVGNALNINLNRASDFGFRLGGEEFGAICTVSSNEEAIFIAEKLRKAIEELGIVHEKNSVSRFISVSIGVAVHNGETTPKDIYIASDAELYKAKESGRNRISLS